MPFICNRIGRKHIVGAIVLLLCLLSFMGLSLWAEEAHEPHSHTSTGASCPKCGATLTGIVYTPTCSAQGYTEYVCLECNEHRELGDYKDKIPHTWEQIDATAATCEKSGSITRRCKVCQEQNTVEDGAALGHDYVSEVVAPTCSSIGYTLHSCTRCQSSYQDEETPKSDHTYSQIVMTEPTCQSTGLCRNLCTVCGEHTSEEMPKVDHDWSSQVVDPTHASQGYTIYTCRFCQTVNRDAYTDPKPYDMKWTVKDATCTESGLRVGYCSDGCGHTETVVIPRLGHEFGQWNVIRQADEETEGLESHTCAICGIVETRTTTFNPGDIANEPGKITPLTVIIVAFLLIVSLGVTVLLFLLLLEHSGREKRRRRPG